MPVQGCNSYTGSIKIPLMYGPQQRVGRAPRIPGTSTRLGEFLRHHLNLFIRHTAILVLDRVHNDFTMGPNKEWKAGALCRHMVAGLSPSAMERHREVLDGLPHC